MKKILILFLFLGSVQLQAQIDRSRVPEPGPAPVIQLPQPVTFTLKNGLRVFVLENRKLPRVSFSLILDIEAIQEGEKAGYAGMAGELLRTGTASRSKDQLDEEIDFIGATLNTSSSGITAASLSRHKEKLLELMTDVLYNPSFPEEEFEKLKKQTLSGLATQKDNPGAIASNVRSVLLYGADHPYGEITTETTVNGIELADCRNYYDTYFSPSIAYLAIVGDISAKEGKKLAQKYFGKWPAREVQPGQFGTPPPPPATTVAMVDRPTSVQSEIRVAYPVDLKTGHPDVIKASVLNQILGGGFSSRLMQNLREDKAYTYGARSSLSSDRIAGSFTASASVRNAVTDSAVHEFLYELEKISESPVTDDELKAAKAYMTGSFARSIESPQTVASYAVNVARYKLPADYYTNYLQRLEAVTVADVQEVSGKYIKPDNAWVIVVGKAAEVAEPLKRFGTVKYYDMYGAEYDPTAFRIPEGMTVEKIFDRYLKVTGGREKLTALQDSRMVMSANVQGQDLSITISQKAPNKFLNVVEVMGMQVMVQAFDGAKGSMMQMGQDMPMNEGQLRDMAFDAAMVSEIACREMNLETRLTGAETIAGKPAYAVEIIKPSGARTVHYYDAETGLKVRVLGVLETPQGAMEQATDFADYREVDGLLFPHSITIPMGPAVMTAVVQSIELNKGIGDEIFEVK
jgi:zinc protease